MTLLKTFTKLGIEEFSKYIVDLKTTGVPNTEIIEWEDISYATVFDPPIELTDKQFSNRFELGEYLFRLFSDIDRDMIIKNEGLGNWLTFYWRDQLAPFDSNGNRKIGRIDKYVYNSHYTRFYYHLVAASWNIYSVHTENAKLFLLTPLNSTNNFLLEIACRQNIISNLNLVEAIKQLYWKDTPGS